MCLQDLARLCRPLVLYALSSAYSRGGDHVARCVLMEERMSWTHHPLKFTFPSSRLPRLVTSHSLRYMSIFPPPFAPAFEASATCYSHSISYHSTSMQNFDSNRFNHQAFWASDRKMNAHTTTCTQAPGQVWRKAGMPDSSSPSSRLSLHASAGSSNRRTLGLY